MTSGEFLHHWSLRCLMGTVERMDDNGTYLTKLLYRLNQLTHEQQLELYQAYVNIWEILVLILCSKTEMSSVGKMAKLSHTSVLWGKHLGDRLALTEAFPRDAGSDSGGLVPSLTHNTASLSASPSLHLALSPPSSQAWPPLHQPHHEAFLHLEIILRAAATGQVWGVPGPLPQLHLPGTTGSWVPPLFCFLEAGGTCLGVSLPDPMQERAIPARKSRLMFAIPLAESLLTQTFCSGQLSETRHARLASPLINWDWRVKSILVLIKRTRGLGHTVRK